MNRLPAALAGLLGALAFAAPAQAGDPIMPLSQVHRGMHCTGYSVVQGTDISSFHADVIDVVSSGGSDTGEPAILIQASGPAVDATGIAEGFSGSPIRLQVRRRSEQGGSGPKAPRRKKPAGRAESKAHRAERVAHNAKNKRPKGK